MTLGQIFALAPALALPVILISHKCAYRHQCHAARLAKFVRSVTEQQTQSLASQPRRHKSVGNLESPIITNVVVEVTAVPRFPDPQRKAPYSFVMSD